MELKLSSAVKAQIISKLLIVPYGIETCVYNCAYYARKLLIVPYGIETSGRQASLAYSVAFNRTLWN